MEFDTSRLRIRHLTEDDAAFILELVNSDGFLQFVGDRGIRTISEAKDNIATKYTTSYPKYGLFAVTLKDTGQVIGSVSYLKRDYMDADDVGYAFLPAFFGKGYAVEASQGLVTWAFDQGKSKVQAMVDPDNQSSIRLLEKLDFVQDGTVVPEGEDEAILKFTLLAGEAS